MKSWFGKVRISAALDAGKRPSPRLQWKVSNSAELRDFEQEMMALDRALRQPAPKPEVPASFHRSIMQAVQAADSPVRAGGHRTLLRWVPISALAAIILLAVWWAVPRPARQPAPDTQSLAAATTALEMSAQLAHAVPSAMVAPLSGELERLNRDLDNTAQFLLASLP